MSQLLPSSGLISLTYIIYALHLFSAITGLMTQAFIVTAFLTGWPSLIAVILNYAKKNDVKSTFLDSHFSWQIRTFWFASMWFAIAFLLMFTIIGIPLGILLFCGTGLWVLYRLIRGFFALSSDRPMPSGSVVDL